MTITGVNKNTNNTFICALILLIYEDNISFHKIIKYLNEIFNFNPTVIYIYYSSALKKELLSLNLFN